MSDTLNNPVIDTSPAPSRTWTLRAFYRRFSVVINTIASLAIGVVLWQYAASRTSTLVMVPLQDIWDALIRNIESGRLLRDFLSSLQGFAIGFVLAMVLGILLGMLMAASKTIFDFLDPWVSALYSTPLIALAPVFIIVFGLGMATKIAVVLSLAVFPIIINTTAGLRTTDRDLIETAQSFGAGRIDVFRKVMLPWSVPFILTGLRLAVGRALIGVVVAEFFGSREGLGNLVFISSQNFDTGSVWLGVFILAIMGTVLIRFMYLVERWVAPWRQSER